MCLYYSQSNEFNCFEAKIRPQGTQLAKDEGKGEGYPKRTKFLSIIGIQWAHIMCQAPPLLVPSPDKKEGGSGLGLATPDRKKEPREFNSNYTYSFCKSSQAENALSGIDCNMLKDKPLEQKRQIRIVK